jgi:hypothetical protein
LPCASILDQLQIPLDLNKTSTKSRNLISFEVFGEHLDLLVEAPLHAKLRDNV